MSCCIEYLLSGDYSVWNIFNKTFWKIDSPSHNLKWLSHSFASSHIVLEKVFILSFPIDFEEGSEGEGKNYD